MTTEMLDLTLLDERGKTINVRVPTRFYHEWKALFGDLSKCQILKLIISILIPNANWPEETLKKIMSLPGDEPCQLLFFKNGALPVIPKKTKKSGNWALRYQGILYRPEDTDLTLQTMNWLRENADQAQISIKRIDCLDDSPTSVRACEVEIVYL